VVPGGQEYYEWFPWPCSPLGPLLSFVMRALAQPGVLKAAVIAAAVSALACYPRVAFWPTRKYPIWYLELLLLFGGTVLWAFVFAWHTKYTGGPVLTLKMPLRTAGLATMLGLCAAALLHVGIDPLLRARTPEDYPATFGQWLAMTLFSLGFTQLFLVFAPFAWLVRLFRARTAAIPLTVLFGAIIMMIKNHAAPQPVPSPLFLELLTVRLVGGLLAIYFYLRGGVLLASWWTLLLQARLLF
jgi:hypothetical protein